MIRETNVVLSLSFFGGDCGSNLGPCIFYALSIPAELNSRWRTFFVSYYSNVYVLRKIYTIFRVI